MMNNFDRFDRDFGRTQKTITGFGVVALLLNVALVGALVFGVVKACDYVTSGTAAQHIQEIKK